MRRRHGIEVLFVDYLQLMEGRDARMARTYQLEEISRGLKALAKELSISVVALAQVSRQADNRKDSEPLMADLKDLGAIEQDADVVAFIHRQIVIEPDLGPEWRNYAKLLIAKNRQGPTGRCALAYIGEETRFAGYEGEEPARKSRPALERGFS